MNSSYYVIASTIGAGILNEEVINSIGNMIYCKIKALQGEKSFKSFAENLFKKLDKSNLIKDILNGISLSDDYFVLKETKYDKSFRNCFFFFCDFFCFRY